MTTTYADSSGTHVPARAELTRVGTLGKIRTARAQLEDLERTIEAELKAAGGVPVAALEQAHAARDGWKARALHAEALVDKAREEMKAQAARVEAITNSIGQSGNPPAAPVGDAGPGLSPDSGPASPSFEALRVAAAVALVVLDGVHTSDGQAAARGLRDALGGA